MAINKLNQELSMVDFNKSAQEIHDKNSERFTQQAEIVRKADKRKEEEMLRYESQVQERLRDEQIVKNFCIRLAKELEDNGGTMILGQSKHFTPQVAVAMAHQMGKKHGYNISDDTIDSVVQQALQMKAPKPSAEAASKIREQYEAATPSLSRTITNVVARHMPNVTVSNDPYADADICLNKGIVNFNDPEKIKAEAIFHALYFSAGKPKFNLIKVMEANILRKYGDERGTSILDHIIDSHIHSNNLLNEMEQDIGLTQESSATANTRGSSFKPRPQPGKAKNEEDDDEENLASASYGLSRR